MDSAVAALWTLVATVVGLLITAAVTFGPLLIQRQRLKLEREVEELRVRASDKAVAVVEDLSRAQGGMSGIDKLVMASKLADESTPRSVAVSPDDVRAAVSRRRASMPTPPSIPPLSIPVTLISDAPPAVPRAPRAPAFDDEQSVTTRPTPPRKP